MKEMEQTSKNMLKLKYILIIFVLGWILTSIGALGKINSESWGGTLINIGYGMQITGGILIIWKLLTIKNLKDFLNT